MGAYLPTDAHRECPLAPISSGDDGHFAVGVRAGAIKYLVGVTVFYSVESVGVSADSIMRMLHRCCWSEKAVVSERRRVLLSMVCHHVKRYGGRRFHLFPPRKRGGGVVAGGCYIKYLSPQGTRLGARIQ